MHSFLMLTGILKKNRKVVVVCKYVMNTFHSFLANKIPKSNSGAQLGGERPPLPFFENRKKCPDFGRKGPNCVHPWVESSIQNVVLRVSRRKSSKMFPCGAFSYVFDEKFIEMP